MAKFELVSRFAGCDELLPKRSTANSAGYDLIVAEDTIVSTYNYAQSINFSLNECIDLIVGMSGYNPVSLEELAKITGWDNKEFRRPRLVSTGVKCKLAPDEYLEIVPRSSTPLKYWLVVANSPGIVDSDYYNNPDNEGEIFVQLINFSTETIKLKKGDKIAQAIIRKYYVTEDDTAGGMRTGGFGSTD